MEQQTEKPNPTPWATCVVTHADGKIEQANPAEAIHGFRQSPEISLKVAEIMRRHGCTDGKPTPEADKEIMAIFGESAPSETGAVEISEWRAYLLAACRLASGQFDTLDDAELFDVALVSRVPVRNIAAWLELRKVSRGRAQE